MAGAGGGGGLTAAMLQYHSLMWALLAAFIAWLAYNIVMSITDRRDGRA